MEIFIILSGLLSFIIIGLSVLSLLNIRFEFLQKSALGFGIGGGVVALELFIFSIFSLPINLFTVLMPWYIIFAYLLKNRKIVDNIDKKTEDMVIIDYLILVLVIASVSLSVIYVLLSPVSSWDAVASWSMLAKGFFYERSLSGSFYTFFNFENPPLVSLQQSFLSILVGEYNDKETMLLYPAYFISLLVLFYSFVKKFSTRTNALIFTFFLASLPLVLGQAGRYNVGYVDLALSYYIFACIVAFARFLKTSQSQSAILLGIMLSIIPLTKNEGMSITGIIIIISSYVSLKKGEARLIPYLLVGILPLLFWKIYSAVERFPVHPQFYGAIETSRVWAIAQTFLGEMISIANWNLLWIAFFMSLLLFANDKLIRIIVLVIFLQLVFYLGIFIYTPADFISHINSTLDRFLLQISPLVMLVIAYAFAKPAIYK